MSTELLRASEAARRLDIQTKELLRLVHGRQIRHEMIDGIAQIPTGALDDYRAHGSRLLGPTVHLGERRPLEARKVAFAHTMICSSHTTSEEAE
jgi:hypothetical protein